MRTRSRKRRSVSSQQTHSERLTSREAGQAWQGWEYLEWDSTFFGYRIGRIIGSRLTEEQWSLTDHWCRDHRIDCLYLMADPASLQTVGAAQAREFQFVDVRVTLERGRRAEPADRVDTDHRIRQWTPPDIPILKEIASRSHRDSRFYADRHFERAHCDALFATWIENSCRGYADAVFVSDVAGALSAYISCHLGAPRTGRIGLVGVDYRSRGQGVGIALVRRALEWFASHDVETVSVVTQGKNAAAMGFYQRCGFVTTSIELCFHGWPLKDRVARPERSRFEP